LKTKSVGIARSRRIRSAAAAIAAVWALSAAGAAHAAIDPLTASGPAPLTVTFTDNTLGATSSSWTFGDGGPGETPTTGNPVTHTYQSPGNYTVSLTSSDGVNPAQTFNASITVEQPPPPPPPNSQFTSAAAPGAGPHAVRFDGSGSAGATEWRWTFGDGTAEAVTATPTIVHPYALPGSYRVTLTACSLAGGCDPTPAAQTITTRNGTPTATFTIFSNPAAKGSTVFFDASASSDPDRDALTYAWDLDGNGTFEATGVTASTVFSAPGNYLVRLRVSDGVATSAVVSQTVIVKDDLPPRPAFSITPPSPSVGQNVTFTDSSSDPDGSIVKLEWDLDGDNQFDDAQGPVAQWSFATPGSRIVSLRATDDKGVAAIAFQTLEVTGPPPAEPGSTPGPPTPASSPGASPSPTRRAVLNPFPIIHIRARVVGGLVHIDLLTVKAPSGATVQVRCHGKTCPVARLTQRVRRGAKTVRFRRLEKRVRAGTVLEIFVTGRGAIGKYTRFKFRPGAAPSRRDLCLPAGSMRPGRCPTP
jgi:PKD repeat protein